MNANAPTKDFSYLHQPLDTQKQQIRLIKVEKNRSGPIKCTIDVFDLRTAPRYSALSYRWGPRIFDHEIIVNGQPLLIGRNLFRFLETFRQERESTHLWIDQICIEQANVKERNHQVGLMSTIYRKGWCTIIWLYDDQGLYPSYARDVVASRKGASFIQLMEDPYFTRLWVVQEILLALRVKILTSENVWVPWEAMRDCMYTTRGWETEKLEAWKALINPEYQSGTDRPSLTWCITNFSGKQCEDPRDKIYGLIGLASQEEPIDIDYKKTIMEVYTDVFLAIPPTDHWKVANYLGEHMGLGPNARGLHPLLDLIVPFEIWDKSEMIHQIIPGLRDNTPVSSPYRGTITSIGLFCEQKARSTSPDCGFSVICDASLCHTLTYVNAGGGPFDIAQTITEFHRRLEQAQAKGPFLEQDWLDQQSIVQGYSGHISEPRGLICLTVLTIGSVIGASGTMDSSTDIQRVLHGRSITIIGALVIGTLSSSSSLVLP